MFLNWTNQNRYCTSNKSPKIMLLGIFRAWYRTNHCSESKHSSISLRDIFITLIQRYYCFCVTLHPICRFQNVTKQPIYLNIHGKVSWNQLCAISTFYPRAEAIMWRRSCKTAKLPYLWLPWKHLQMYRKYSKSHLKLTKCSIFRYCRL